MCDSKGGKVAPAFAEEELKPERRKRRSMTHVKTHTHTLKSLTQPLLMVRPLLRERQSLSPRRKRERKARARREKRRMRDPLPTHL